MDMHDRRTGPASVTGRFFAWLPALLAAQLVLVLQSLLGGLPAGGGDSSGWLPGVLAIGQGLLTLLRALPLLALLSWPLLLLRSGHLRLLAVGTLWSLLLLAETGLEHYYRVSGTLLGADLFGYSRAEIATTLSGADDEGGALWWSLLLPLLVLWCLLWALARLDRTALSGRPAMAVLAAGALAWLLPLAPGLQALPSQAARDQASSKLAWFTADVLRWSRHRVALVPVAEARLADGPEPPLDPAHPFLREERSPDVLGEYFEDTPSGRPPNLVVIIVEGLGRSFSGPDARLGSFTPFLDELATRSLYFDNFLANQGRTFAVLPSLLGSLPFAEQGFNALGAQMPAHPGLYSVLRGQGYDTAFYAGTDLDFDNQRAYLQAQQAARLVDLHSFGPGYQRNPHSEWGYPDAELVSRVLADNGQLQPPFLLGMQTISMHTSYRFPGQQRYRERLEERLEALAVPAPRRPAYRAHADVYSTILYSDEQLRRYFEGAARTPWYAETIFIVTGDHRLPEIPMDEHIERYHVPLLIHSPLLRRPARIGGVASHMDVTPSLLALLAHRYGLQRPARVPWLGRGLDMSPGFASSNTFPLKQTKTSEPEYLDGRWWLREGRLYALEQGMRLVAVDDAAALARVRAGLQQYTHANALMLRDRTLGTDAWQRQLVAYDPARVEQRPRAQAMLPGLGVEDVEVVANADGIVVQARWINGDDRPSATFVPLAVLGDEAGNGLHEVYGQALQLEARAGRRLRLQLPAVAGEGRYYVSLLPSDPDTGRALGRGRYRVPVDLAAGTARADAAPANDPAAAHPAGAPR